MTTGLEPQGVGDDGADRGGGEQSRNHVLRTVQQDAHQQAALFLDRDCLGAAAAPRHVVVI